MTIYDYERLPFFEFREATDDKIGAKWQMYDLPIREQIKEIKKNHSGEGKIFYMECIKIDNTKNMPEIDFAMKSLDYPIKKRNEISDNSNSMQS